MYKISLIFIHVLYLNRGSDNGHLGTLVFEVFIYFYNLLNNIVELWRWKKTLKNIQVYLVMK